MSQSRQYNTRSRSTGEHKRKYYDSDPNLEHEINLENIRYKKSKLKLEIHSITSYINSHSENIITLTNKIEDIIKMIKIYIICKRIISQEKVTRNLQLSEPDVYSHLKISWSMNQPSTLNIIYEIEQIQLNSLTIKTMPDDQFIKICNSYPLIYTLLNNLYKYLFNLQQKNIQNHNKFTLLLNNKKTEFKSMHKISEEDMLSEDILSEDILSEDMLSEDISEEDILSEEDISLYNSPLEDISLEGISLGVTAPDTISDNIFAKDITKNITNDFTNIVILQNIEDNLIKKDTVFI